MFRSGLKRIGKKLLGRGEPAAKPAPSPAAEPAPAWAPRAFVKPESKGAVEPAAAAAAKPLPEPVLKELPEVVAKTAPQAAPKAAPAPKTGPVALVVEKVAAPVAAAAVAPAPATPAPAAKHVSSFANLAAMAASGQLGEARHADQSGTDLDAYRERMRVNGREDIKLAGIGLNTAEDGTQFVGPVNNESSRAKAVGLVLSIDQHECISCGTCVEQTEDVFFLGEDDKSGDEVKAEVLKQEGPMDLIQDAIDACPVTCIHWLDGEELTDIHSAGGLTA
ncbi:MAG: ferredoxin [Cognaticolwellia sp.]|jgi:ferredoxin